VQSQAEIVWFYLSGGLFIRATVRFVSERHFLVGMPRSANGLGLGVKTTSRWRERKEIISAGEILFRFPQENSL